MLTAMGTFSLAQKKEENEMNNLGPFQVNCSLIKIFPSAGFLVGPVNPSGTVNKKHYLATPGEEPELITSTSNPKKQLAKYNSIENMETSEPTPEVVNPGTTLLAMLSPETENKAKLPGTFKI